MSALKSIGLALDVATARRDEAARALGQQFERQRQAEAQLEQLQSYAEETAQRWAPGGAARTQPSRESVIHYYQFMERLQQTAEMQRHAITRIARDIEAARALLTQADLRIASLRHVYDLRLAERARSQARRDQQQTDEFAALAHRRRASALAQD